jgi:hypothetical protein
MIYFSSRLADHYWQTRRGGRLRRRVGLRRLLSVRPKVSVGLPPASVTIEGSEHADPVSLWDRYDQLRRALRRELRRFPVDHLPGWRQPPIEFDLNAQWGYMAFLGVGKNPNSVSRGESPLKPPRLTFWLQGTAVDGSIVVLIGSAYNLLATDIPSLRDSGVRLAPMFNYPSSTEGLTALVQSVCPELKTAVPSSEWSEIDSLETDIAAFALRVSMRSDGSEKAELYDLYDFEGPDAIRLRSWMLSAGRVRGLARIYAVASADTITRSYSELDWLPTGVQVVVGAPYAVYRG